ncbi:MAG: porin [Proteobacteria bacterium]|nr:porin [Pseudomonadota bacterium]
MNHRPLTGLLLFLLLGGALPARAADAGLADTERRLEQRIDRLQEELDALRVELRALKGDASAVVAAAPPKPAAPPVPPAPQDAAPLAGASADLSLWGYGEAYYMRPTRIGASTEFDLARAVFGIGYRFDDRTVFNSEFEVEHAVSSAGDRGEVEVEQFFIDHQLADWAGVKAGLFLMPFGLLNEHHEPTNFYGVQRNFVETLIIPSTWREGGVALHGATTSGWRWDAGLTTGLNLQGWEANPEDPLYRTAYELGGGDAAPFQAMHQELQFARAQNLSQYLSLGYTGVPGLLAGAAVFTGKTALPAQPPGLPDVRATLWEAHARWTRGAADLSAVYARGTLSNTAAYNLANPGSSNPLPAAFLGYYLQGAYTVWQNDRYRLAPFVRVERYDLGASYDGIAPGFATVPVGLAADGKPWPQPRDRVWTAGANFYLNPHVVLKADYQHFSENPDLTRVDLGLGLSF